MLISAAGSGRSSSIRRSGSASSFGTCWHRGKVQGRRWSCVLRPGSLVSFQPCRSDASLPAVLVRQAADLTQDPLSGTQSPASIGPAHAGLLMDRPKEPDAGPYVRFCERRGGAIHRAYSTEAVGRPESDAAHLHLHHTLGHQPRCLAQLAVLALQRLHPLVLIGRDTGPFTLGALGPARPVF